MSLSLVRTELARSVFQAPILSAPISAPGSDQGPGALSGPIALVRTMRESMAERKLIELVNRGEWEIDKRGAIWRVQVRTGCRWHGTKLVDVERRRAEHRTPLGYLQVRAVLAGRAKRLCCGAHRLVWQHFFGDIPEGLTINHFNGIKDDNRPENLEVVTYSDNQKHAYSIGLIDQNGERNPTAAIDNATARTIREAFATGLCTQRELAHWLGIGRHVVGDVASGRSYLSAGGPITIPRQFHYLSLSRTRRNGEQREPPEAIAAILRREGKLP